MNAKYYILTYLPIYMKTIKLKCPNKKCKHEWNYKGKSKFYTTCPKCLYKVRVKNA